MVTCLTSWSITSGPARVQGPSLDWGRSLRFSPSWVCCRSSEWGAGFCRRPSLWVRRPLTVWSARASISCTDEETGRQRDGPKSAEVSIPVLTLSEAVTLLQHAAVVGAKTYRAMYSSVIGAITTDVAAMVVPIDDHMVHRGHAVFDTTILIKGCLYELDAHLDRLLRSAAKSRIAPPFDRATMREILLQTVAASDCRDGELRYWLSAGRGGFGLSSAECDKPTFYAMVVDVGFHEESQEGTKVVTSTVPIKPPSFATVKSVNYLLNALSKMEAEEKGAFAGIWLDDEGFIAEGPNMNVAFVSNDSELLVPHFDKILLGCTVRRMLELIPQLISEKAVPGLKGVKVQKISMEEAKNAAEMMLIGSGVLIMPVLEWDGKPVGNGQPGLVTLALREALKRDMVDGPPTVLVPVPYK